MGNNFKSVTAVMPYNGSKRRIAKMILKHFPRSVERMVEPFAGSATISMHVLYNGITNNVWINDAHKPLASLWRHVVSDPDGLADKYESMWTDHDMHGRHEFFMSVRDRFNSTHTPADYLYLLARCTMSAVRFNGDGEFNSSPDNRRSGANPTIMRKRITTASDILKNHVKITSHDYRKVLERCDKTDVIYMDPPYQGTSVGSGKRYHGEFVHEEFCQSLEDLKSRKIQFIVSYDGKNGDKTYGKPMPKKLGLKHIMINAGRSTQSTLLGRDDHTYESLYLSKF